jgi:agmatine deiminase
MPAEWEPHERCLMAWPTRTELWGELLEAARRDYATVATAIARFEPVLMLVTADELDAARSVCGPGVELVAFELDDSWTRDTGPLFARGGDGGGLVGVDFEFNGWGGKYTPHDRDATLAARVLELLGVPRDPVELVLEGGAITVDGEGTLITTESVLLNENRNPGRSREQIEALLAEHLGVETIIWLAAGLVEDRDTDGHVDNVCAFVAPGRVLVQAEPDPDKPNHQTLTANAQQLRASRDARGRELDVLELPVLPYVSDAPLPTVAPYLNFYLANGAVIVPVTGTGDDARALELIAVALPGRVVVPVPGATLARGGGGVHCITQQVPVAERALGR